MASKKKPNIKIPLDDIVRNAIRAAGKKSRKIGQAVKKADSAAEAKRYAEFKKGRPSAADRAAKRAERLDAETRRSGVTGMVREYDRMIKSEQVNNRIATGGDDTIFGIRERKGKPITPRQIKQAQEKSKGMKKNIPKFVKNQQGMSENEMLAKAAKKQKRMEENKAAGGVNAPKKIAKRQSDRAAKAKEAIKNRKKKK
jgi:hypothetical protein